MVNLPELPSKVSFYLLASTVLFLLAGSSTPTPLYSVYQADWGFSPITVTVIFGAYAIAVLVSLLVVGRLSDHVGRKPVLLAALAVQAVAMVLFAVAPNVDILLAARVVQGLGAGAALGAIGAAMLDIDRQKGTIWNAVAPMVGTATGALLSALFVQYLPAPTKLVYFLLLAVFVAQIIGIALMRETSSPTPGAIASLRPSFALPSEARQPLAIAAPILIAAWAIPGFYGSLGPSLVRSLTHSDSYVYGGLALFVLAAAAALTVAMMHKALPIPMMLLGTASVFIGIGITTIAISQESATALFAGAVIAGMGFGAGFQGAIRTVMPLIAPHQRAGVLSIIFVISYLALGVPAVIAGYAVAHGTALLDTARDYSFVVMALAAIAFTGTAWQRRSTLRSIERDAMNTTKAEAA